MKKIKLSIIGSRGYPYVYSGYETFVKELSERIKDEFAIMTFNGRERSSLKLKDWIIEAQDRGIGEIMITSIDKEGTMNGFDLNLLEYIIPFLKVPIICSGGISSSEHANECFKNGADAVAIAKAFHFSYINPITLRNELSKMGITLRNIKNL